MAVPVQAERPALLFGLRHEHGQEHQDEQDGPRQHQRAHQTEIVQGTGFEQQQRQEGAHRGDVAHQQRIDLVGERLALVFLVFQMVHIVERIVHGDADDHRADAQDDDRDRTLEEREHAQRESRAEENRHTDPEDIGKAAERQPEHQTDEQQGDGDRQEAVFLDTGRILGCHQRTACRENVYAGAIGLHLRRHVREQLRQVGVAAGFAAAERRIEEHHAAAAVGGEDMTILHPIVAHGVQITQAREDRREEAERVAPEPISRQRLAGRIERLPDFVQPRAHIARLCEQRVDSRIIFIRKEIRHTCRDEIENFPDLPAIDGYLQVGDPPEGIARFPGLGEAVHSRQDAVHGFFRLPFPFEEHGDLVLSAKPLVDVRVTLRLFVVRQESRDIFLVAHAEGREQEQGQQGGQQHPHQRLMRREIVVEPEDRLLHRFNFSSSIRG